MQTGLVVILFVTLTVKLVPATRDATNGASRLVLHVTPVNLPAKPESSPMRIMLFAVTAVVSTMRVTGFVPVGITTAPLAALLQAAGDALEAQFVAVP